MNCTMNPIVQPLVSIEINWEVLLETAKTALQRTVTGSIDANSKTLGDFASYIAALGEMETPNTHPDKVLVEPGSLLKQLFFGFMIVSFTDDFHKIRYRTDLAIHLTATVYPGVSMAVVSGTLEQWRTAVINCCIERIDLTIRLVFNKILSEFEKMGLYRIWLDYSKVKLKDDTIKLV